MSTTTSHHNKHANDVDTSSQVTQTSHTFAPCSSITSLLSSTSSSHHSCTNHSTKSQEHKDSTMPRSECPHTHTETSAHLPLLSTSHHPSALLSLPSLHSTLSNLSTASRHSNNTSSNNTTSQDSSTSSIPSTTASTCSDDPSLPSTPSSSHEPAVTLSSLSECAFTTQQWPPMDNIPSKVVFILRGLPGSGKTCLAQSLLQQHQQHLERTLDASSLWKLCSDDNFGASQVHSFPVHHCDAVKPVVSGVIVSADKFFVGDDHVYRFSGKHIAQAHSSCLSHFIDALHHDIACICLDNANSTKWEYLNYAKLAKIFGYEVRVLEIACPSLQVLQVFQARNPHSVPFSSCVAMHKRWESDESAHVIKPVIISVPTNLHPLPNNNNQLSTQDDDEQPAEHDEQKADQHTEPSSKESNVKASPSSSVAQPVDNKTSSAATESRASPSTSTANSRRGSRTDTVAKKTTPTLKKLVSMPTTRVRVLTDAIPITTANNIASSVSPSLQPQPAHAPIIDTRSPSPTHLNVRAKRSSSLHSGAAPFIPHVTHVPTHALTPAISSINDMRKAKSRQAFTPDRSSNNYQHDRRLIGSAVSLSNMTSPSTSSLSSFSSFSSPSSLFSSPFPLLSSTSSDVSSDLTSPMSDAMWSLSGTPHKHRSFQSTTFFSSSTPTSIVSSPQLNAADNSKQQLEVSDANELLQPFPFASHSSATASSSSSSSPSQLSVSSLMHSSSVSRDLSGEFSLFNSHSHSPSNQDKPSWNTTFAHMKATGVKAVHHNTNSNELPIDDNDKVLIGKKTHHAESNSEFHLQPYAPNEHSFSSLTSFLDLPLHYDSASLTHSSTSASRSTRSSSFSDSMAIEESDEYRDELDDWKKMKLDEDAIQQHDDQSALIYQHLVNHTDAE